VLKIRKSDGFNVVGRRNKNTFLNNKTNFSHSGIIQSDQKESKSEQALQIICHVVAESCANKHSMHGVDNLWFQTLPHEFYKINNEQHCTFIRMGNLPDLLPTATSKKRQF
jgi:hypothetical protein